MSRRDTAAMPVRPAHWDRPAVPTPTVAPTQAEQRDRRRNRLTVVYDGTFDLVAEVAEIVTPMAVAVSTLRSPLAMRSDVASVADAVAEVVHVGAGLVAESKAAEGRTRRAAADLAVRPRVPVITEEQIVKGSWSTVMAAYAGQVADDLRALLGRALPPDHGGLHGQSSASERVERSLRGLDRAAADLDRRIERVRLSQSMPSVAEFNRQQRERHDQERAADALARLGVTP